MSRRLTRLGLAVLAIGGFTLIATRPRARRAPAAEARPRELAPTPRPAPTALVAAPDDAPPDLARLPLRDAWAWVRDHSARYTPAEEIPLVAVFFRHLAARDPSAVLAFATESLSRADGAMIASAAVDVLIENGRLDLARQQVERWVALPTRPALGGALQTVAWQLALASDRSAAEWLATLPASPERDAAFAGLAGNWANHDAAAAMEWSMTLPAGPVRLVALQRAFRVWSDHDDLAAAQWLLEHEAAPEADALILTWAAHAPAGQENRQLAQHWKALVRDERR